MPIIFSVVARGNTILAKYASCIGNFSDVCDQILEKITPDQPPRLTYSHDHYFSHYALDEGITYLCITNDGFPKEKAFLFLNEIVKRFQVTYGSQALNALPYAMNSEFSQVLATQMKFYSDNLSNDKMTHVQEEIDQLKDIMVKNINSVSERGEKLELLVDKAENLDNSSVQFYKSSRNLKRAMFFKNIKLILLFILIFLVVIYIIVSVSCGGMSWPQCV